MTDAAQGEPLAQTLAAYNSIYIEQKFMWLDGCCEQANIYNAYSERNGQHLFEVREKSKCCERVFCAPLNSLFLEFKIGGSQDVAYTMERRGCCGGKFCLCCCACTPACAEEVTFHRGPVQGDVGEVMNPNPVFTMRQAPAPQSMFNPVINVWPGTGLDANGEVEPDPAVTITGPFCFGGCSECCLDSQFPAVNNKTHAPAGTMKKLHPETFTDLLKEMCTDTDRFQVEFDQNATPGDKMALVASTFVADYMMFEQDNGMCGYDAGQRACYVTCWQCYCCGCLVPCKCYCGGGSNDAA